ncbi:MAG: sigma-70 family RNA polymerase sigma factor [bacterium]|nr:sigma-70 family RNA polymerase sigma factor [bacterium]
MNDDRSEITRRLIAWSEGDESALERLMPLVEKELRRIAERYFEREDSGHTLQPTALVNELYLRLVGRRRVSWNNRAHFFGFAADTMRKILVDHARIRRAEKRGKGVRPLPLDYVTEVEAPQPFDFPALDQALRRLAEIDPRQERVVVLRAFTGLTHEEIAGVLGVTSRTVKRDWRTARLWLHKELKP